MGLPGALLVPTPPPAISYILGSHPCTGRSKIEPLAAEIHRQRLEEEEARGNGGHGRKGEWVARNSVPTVASTLVASLGCSSSAGRTGSAMEMPSACSASATSAPHERWFAGRRKGGLGLQMVQKGWFGNGGRTLDSFVRVGSNCISNEGLGLVGCSQRNSTVGPVASNCMKYRSRVFSHKAAQESSSASLCAVAWIPGSAQYGRCRRCVAAHAEMAKDPQNHREQRVKQEVHGRRMRVGRPKPCGPHDNVMLQGFNWESHKGLNGKTWWEVLKSQAEELCTLGVTDIWLPPPSQSVDKQGYLPGELYNLDASKYGTGVQLKELIDKCHEHGISVIADIVINHRSGKLQDNKGHWNVFKGGNRDKRLDWGPWAVVDDDAYDSGGKGQHDTGESYAAAPDLDHTNKQVQDELTDWLNWMKAEIGFDGWRFDFVKGYAPEYTAMYCRRTNPTIAVGELWTSMAYYEGQLSWDQNGHRQHLCNWIDGAHGSSCAFDFTTKGILQRAVENEYWRLKDAHGKPPGLIGWWPEKAVTFLDNHDTGSTQRHWAFPDKEILQGYAYLLTHPGIPCIFYDHIYQYKLKEQIKELVALRKRHRINAVSRVNIQKAEGDIYVAKIDNRVIIKLGRRYDMGSLLPGKDSWKMTITGPEFAIWETTAPPRPPRMPPAQAEEADKGLVQIQRPTQPIHITSTMSEATRNKILKEIPELVDNIDTFGNKPTR